MCALLLFPRSLPAPSIYVRPASLSQVAPGTNEQLLSIYVRPASLSQVAPGTNEQLLQGIAILNLEPGALTGSLHNCLVVCLDCCAILVSVIQDAPHHNSQHHDPHPD